MGRRPLTFSLAPTGYADHRFTLPDMSEPLHRQRSATRVRDTHRAKELLRLAGEIAIELRERNAKAPSPGIARLPTPSFNEMEALAVEIRLVLNREESGPIRNLTSAVERAGICLIPIVGLSGIDGISAWVEDQPVIGLSPAVAGERFRFSLAHELAHLIFHRTKGKVSEDQANRFAGAFLIPQEDYALAIADVPMLTDFIALKRAWGLSIGAFVYRGHELGHLDDGRYRSLQIQMSKWRKAEPGELAPAFGSLLSWLVEEAGGTVTAAQDLGVPRRHVREVTNWSPLRTA